MREIPCEDYSASFSSSSGQYHIAIVADGHGSSACFRSAIGSKVAVEVAMECLKSFAEITLESTEMENRFYQDIFSNPRYRQMTIRRLTDTIISSWHDRVTNDYKSNLPSPEEFGEIDPSTINDDRISHVYGTTLIAALQLPQCLIILHQGDGRCDVFYSDGTVNQPVPWDSRCEDTATTSMCDKDALTSIRNCVINLDERSVVACFLGSDGVEDAYRDTYEDVEGAHFVMGGVHTFYKNLFVKIAELSTDHFSEYLKDMLPSFSADGLFSRSGSGDDVSVAGIVDINSIGKLIERFTSDIKRYELEEKLFWTEDELRSKTRKHGILLKRMNEAQIALDFAKSEVDDLGTMAQKLSQEMADTEKQIEQSERDIEEFKKSSGHVTDCLEGKDGTPESQALVNEILQIWAKSIRQLYEEISEGFGSKERQHQKLLDRVSSLQEDITNLHTKRAAKCEEVKTLEKTFLDAKAAFDEYDKTYQEVDSERHRVLAELDALG